MKRSRRASLLVIAFGLLSACSGAAPSSAPSTVTTPTVAPSPAASPFLSARHGYVLDVPPGWELVEYEGTWTSLEQFSPGAEVPGEDVVASPDVDAFLVLDSMAIPEAMTEEDWLSAFDALVAEAADDACPPDISEEEFVGERANVVRQSCDGSVLVGRSLTHGGRGYYFTIRYPEDDSETGATLEAMLASIRFTD